MESNQQSLDYRIISQNIIKIPDRQLDFVDLQLTRYNTLYPLVAVSDNCIYFASLSLVCIPLYTTLAAVQDDLVYGV